LGGGPRHHPCIDDFDLPVPKENAMASKPRQVRVQITGGLNDITRWCEVLETSVAPDENFIKSFQDGPMPFGDVGPLHKVVVGFIQHPDDIK
jgi:hypothetical protein